MLRDKEQRLIQRTAQGLYCHAGDFYIDPWQPVDRAVITHAHSDHARWGSRSYLSTPSGLGLLRQRLPSDAAIQTLPFGKTLRMNDAQVSFHPAGHMLGSAQVRVEHRGEVWVVSGDYKIQADASCESFELVKCHAFISESTFGLPIYRWDDPAVTFGEINRWWRSNQQKGRTSVLFCYAVGKAQRLMMGIDSSIGPLLGHGAILRFHEPYQKAGIALPKMERAEEKVLKGDNRLPLVLAPPSAAGTPWLRKFGDISTAFASGWMQIRGARRRRALDQGFVVSDHADWSGLLETIKATGAEWIGVTHGYTGPLARYLQEKGWQAEVVPTQFEGEVDDAGETLPGLSGANSGAVSALEETESGSTPTPEFSQTLSHVRQSLGDGAGGQWKERNLPGF